MKKLLVVFVSLAFTMATFAQKEDKEKFDIDKKAQVFLVNEQPVFKFEESKNTGNPGIKNYYFTNLEGKKLLFFVYSSYKSLKEVSQSNPDGKVSYYEVHFLNGNEQVVEVGYNVLKAIGRMVHKKGLIKNGELDPEAVKYFILESGTPFSKRRDGGI